MYFRVTAIRVTFETSDGALPSCTFSSLVNFVNTIGAIVSTGDACSLSLNWHVYRASLRCMRAHARAGHRSPTCSYAIGFFRQCSSIVWLGDDDGLKQMHSLARSRLSMQISGSRGLLPH